MYVGGQTLSSDPDFCSECKEAPGPRAETRRHDWPAGHLCHHCTGQWLHHPAEYRPWIPSLPSHILATLVSSALSSLVYGI